MKITPLTSADFEQWEPLWLAYQRFYDASLGDDITRLSFQRLTSGKEPMGGFMARDHDAAPSGFVTWIAHRSTWSAGDYCYLQDVFVDPGHRGKGAGRALIHAVYALADERACSRVYWLTHHSNTAARHLYDEVANETGFIQYRHLIT